MRKLLARSLNEKLQLKLVNDLSKKLDRNTEYAAIIERDEGGVRVVTYENALDFSDPRRPELFNDIEETNNGY